MAVICQAFLESTDIGRWILATTIKLSIDGKTRAHSLLLYALR